MSWLDEFIKEETAKDPEFPHRLEEAGRDIKASAVIRRRRAESGLTQEQFAELLGISVEDLDSYEQSDFWNTDRDDTARRINQALNSLDSKLPQPE